MTSRTRSFGTIDLAIFLVSVSISVVALYFVLSQVLFIASAESHHKDSNQLYRVESTFVLPGGQLEHSARSPAPVREVLAKTFPSVVEQTSVYRTFGNISYKNHILESDIYFVEHNANQLLEFAVEPIVMPKPGQILIEQGVARQLFGETDPFGEVVKLGRRFLEVSGVFKVRDTSHLKVPILLSIEDPAFLESWPDKHDWYSADAYSYIKVLSRKDLPTDHELREMIKAHAPPIPGAPFLPEDFLVLEMRSFSDIQFDRGLSDDIYVVVTPLTYWMLVFSGILIMTLVYVNVLSSHFVSELVRIRDYAIKQILGASVSALAIEQIFRGTVVLALVYLVSVPSVYLLHDHFELPGAEIFQSDFVYLTTWFLITGSLIVSAFITSLVILSLVSSTNSAVTNRYSGLPMAFLGKGSLCLQSFISAVLISVAVVLIVDTKSLSNDDHGYRSDTFSISLVNLDSTEITHLTSFLTKESIPHTRATWIPFASDRRVASVRKEKEDDPVTSDVLQVDHKFFDIWGVAIEEGEVDRSLELSKDSVVVTKDLCSVSEDSSDSDCVGMRIFLEGKPYYIRAVVEKIKLSRITEDSIPQLYVFTENGTNKYLSFRIDDAERVNQVWEDLLAHVPVNFEPTPVRTERAYGSEAMIANTFLVTAIVAISSSILALLIVARSESRRIQERLTLMRILGSSNLDNVGKYVSLTFLPSVAGFCLAAFFGLYLFNAVGFHNYSISVFYGFASIFFLACFQLLMLVGLYTVYVSNELQPIELRE